MAGRGTIWLGDYLRAVRLLEADEETARSIAGLLKMERHPESEDLAGGTGSRPDNRAQGLGTGRVAEAAERTAFRVVRPTPKPAARPEMQVSPETEEATIPARLVPLAPAGRSFPAFLGIDTLPELEPTERHLDPNSAVPTRADARHFEPGARPTVQYRAHGPAAVG